MGAPAQEDLLSVWASIEAGRLDEAETSCRALLSSSIKAEFALGIIRFRKGDPVEALALLEGYLDKAPDDVSALGLTAQLLIEAGRGDRAIELGRRAYELRPEEGPLLLRHIEGKSFLAKNQPLSSLRAFRDLIRLDPRQPAGYLGAADAYLALGSTFDAIELLWQAARLAPARGTLLRVGTLELKVGRPEKAFEAARVVLAKEPKEPNANVLAGQSLIEQGREARAFWEGAPDNALTELRHGSSLAMMGLFEESEAHLWRSVELEPKQGNAYHLIFANRKARKGDEGLISQMEREFHGEGLAPTERAALGFALGKAWDDLDDPGKGFGYYDEAHEIQRMLLPAPFDPQRLIDQFEAQKVLFSGSVVPFDDGGPAPIFVVGMLRSGTTLTEQILSAHSQVVGAGEVDFWAGSEPLLVERSVPLFVKEAAGERRAAYRRILSSFGGKERRVVDKFPGNLNVVGMIHHLFPNAHIICLRRRLIDIAVSVWGIHSNPFSPFTVSRESVVFALRHSRNVAEYWKSVIPADRFLEVGYEDLVAEPEKWIKTILSFCDLPLEEACFRSSENKSKVRTPSLWQVKQPVYRTSVDRWQRYEPWLGEFKQLLSP
jgi:tetratricopeptide (TPR) repeat protein